MTTQFLDASHPELFERFHEFSRGCKLMLRRRLGIMGQLIAGIVITTVCALGLLGFVSIGAMERSALNWKIFGAKRTFDLIKQGESDPASIIKFLRAEGIDAYRLVYKDGRALTSGEFPASGLTQIPDDSGMKLHISNQGLWSLGDRLVAEDTVGQFTLSLSIPLSDVREEAGRTRDFLIAFALLDSIIIIALGVYLLSRSIVGPIKRLDESARRISGGRLDERSDVRVDNEVGSLASSFNSMADSLSDKIKSLEAVNAELVSAQEELLRSKTLAAVGSLAAGVAHEMGNPLASARGYVEMLRDSINDNDERDMAVRAAKELSRIDAIVSEFLDMARPVKRPSEPIDVNSLVRDTVSELKNDSGLLSDIEVSLDLQSDALLVFIDPNKLRQVFVNVLQNSAHALDGMANGSIAISSGVVQHGAQTTHPHRRREDAIYFAPARAPYARLSFVDKGKGMSEAELEKAFDPFYTTKEVGKGTGLGLFVSRTIINAHGGAMELKSNEGKGTELTILLPMEIR